VGGDRPDANIAQALRPAFVFTEGLLAAESEGLLAAESEDMRQRWLPRVMAGDILGTAGRERGAANGVVQAKLTPDGENFRANGTKSYSTGALFADWVSTSALDADGEAVSFTVPKDREGLRLLDDWDGTGQRLTASGTTQLDNLLVFPGGIRRPRCAAGNWRLRRAAPPRPCGSTTWTGTGGTRAPSRTTTRARTRRPWRAPTG
jgi:alkylation response protein AidB-like acyl-CoA dehydrogenase